MLASNTPPCKLTFHHPGLLPHCLQGDFCQWIDLFNHFDSYLETVLKARADLNLEGSLADDAAFPKEAVMEVLRVTALILENCSNKHFYNSVEVSNTRGRAPFETPSARLKHNASHRSSVATGPA